MSDDQQHPMRKGERKNVQRDLSPYMFVAKGRVPFRCLGVDASREGLGIVCFESLEPQTQLLLVVKERGITLEVVWCRQDPVRKNIYHIGLHCKDVATNIAGLLEAEGLVRPPEAPKAAPAAPAAGKAAAPGSQITFAKVREAVAILHSYDQSILGKIGMDTLSRTHRAYPIQFQGKSLVVLLSQDLRPKEASTLSDEDAARRVLIVAVDKGVGKVVWPEKPAKAPEAKA